MIDTEKMKALATQLREWNWLNDPTPQKAADAIDTLLAALEAAQLERDKMMKALAECRDKAHVEGYGKSFLYEAIACPDDVPAFIGQTVTELRAALEAREADRRLTGDRLTDEKARHIMQRDGYKLTGVVLATDDGARCIVEMGAVRWLSHNESWSLMHPVDLRRAPASEGEQK
ncbi:hypothetical protein LGM14_18355 [Burkholderia multivorans]|nr:hypothetical protein [Burkholderia multivorans]